MDTIKSLVGKKVLKLRMNEQYLIFETDKGNIAFTVEGECCSSSYFYDFHGVEKLLQNGEIIEAEEVPLEVDEKTIKADDEDEEVEAYGYRLTTKHEIYSEQSSVFSFRNSSNGYYGGWMESVESFPDDIPEITVDTTLE